MQTITLKEIEKKDYPKAIGFAIRGMHFDMYLDSPLLLGLYGTYFWYDELNHATQVIAAYQGDTLVGVLLADMEGQPKCCRSWVKRVFVGIFNFLQNLLYKGGVDIYDGANARMYQAFRSRHTPDGQLIFLAADPDAKIPGVGTALLQELERREPGKRIYLYTDDACTYPFYEHRGFCREAEEDIVMDLQGRTVPLKCMLYSKVTGS